VPRRITTIGCALAAAALASVAAPERAAAGPTADGFARPLTRWKLEGGLRAVRVPSRRDNALRISAAAGPGRATYRLHARRWALSLDLALAPGSAATIQLGSERRRLRISPSSKAGGWVRLQARAIGRRVTGSLGGEPFKLRGPPGSVLGISVRRGGLLVDTLVVSPPDDAGLLLLHRLADLDARVPERRFLLGADGADRIRFKRRTWTRGFLAGALWEAAELLPGRDAFDEAALQRSLSARGYEDADSHDLGFVYESSSVAAYRARCRTVTARSKPLCRRLLRSGLQAADRLLELEATNPVAGTLPTRSQRPSVLEADTIVDSVMNLPLLFWASDITGDPLYRDTAARHAHKLAELLVRPDGSTFQSVHIDRLSGAVLRHHTHQGMAPDTTWARGQGWAVYGFTTSAAALRDPVLLEVAERAAGFVERRLPASGVPSYDYDLPFEHRDTSAAAITAAGLFRLDALCAEWVGACRGEGRWRPLADRMLSGALVSVRRSSPLGFLDDQVGSFGGAVWDDRAELVYGLRYAMEAVRRSRSGR